MRESVAADLVAVAMQRDAVGGGDQAPVRFDRPAHAARDIECAAHAAILQDACAIAERAVRNVVEGERTQGTLIARPHAFGHDITREPAREPTKWSAHLRMRVEPHLRRGEIFDGNQAVVLSFQPSEMAEAGANIEPDTRQDNGEQPNGPVFPWLRLMALHAHCRAERRHQRGPSPPASGLNLEYARST